MRRPIIAGNWKMNGTQKSVESLLLTILKDVDAIPEEVELIVFPPFVFLGQAQTLLLQSRIAWGGQNVCAHPGGAFTGEISVSMLRDFGCRYVLVGHSERRTLFGETQEMILAKYIAAMELGITPIVCIGETLDERKKGMTSAVLRSQLDPLFFLKDGSQRLKHAVIAYEPVWAIGTGLTAQPETAQEVHHQIRTWVAEYDKEVAEGLRILYGGSVKRDNAAELFAMPDIDGGLIGGASLTEEFLDIAKSCSS